MVLSVQRQISTVTGASAATLAVVTGVSRGCTQAPSATSTRSGMITTPTAYRCTTWRRTASAARASPWRCCVRRARRVSLTWPRRSVRCYRGSRSWRSSSAAAPLLALAHPLLTPCSPLGGGGVHSVCAPGRAVWRAAQGYGSGCQTVLRSGAHAVARFHDAWWWNVCVTV